MHPRSPVLPNEPVTAPLFSRSVRGSRRQTTAHLPLTGALLVGLLGGASMGCEDSADTTSGGATSATGGSGAGGSSSGGAGGDVGGSGGGGGRVDPQAPCPAGSELSATDTDAGYAEFGSVFSSTPYERDVEGTHNPKALVVEVKSAGAAVAGCEVRWETAAGHGWVFPNGTVTDAEGRIRAFWTSGDQESQSADARIEVEGGAAQTVTFSGEAWPSARTRTDSVHVLYDVPDAYTEFKVRVTPMSGPQSTYYSTLNWPGAYGGIQFDDYGGPITKVLFSVWDIDANNKAEITDPGDCNELVGFGGEGTGTSCRLLLPPSEHGPIPGLPDDYMLQPGDTYETHLVITYPADCPTCSDYTFTFTDVTRGLGPISLGTQRYKENVQPWYGSGFVEDWWDEPGDHCLNSDTRTAYFHDLQAKTATGWQPITSASFNAVYLEWNHEICANYFFGVEDGKFLVSSGGTELVSRPIIEGDPDFGELPRESL